MGRVRRAIVLGIGIFLLGALAAHGATFELSDLSSDETPASSLSATFSYALVNQPTQQQLEISVRNDTSTAAPFDISAIFFNTAPEVSYIGLDGATSSISGDNTAKWRLGYYGYDLVTVRFGEFGYSLRTDPGGANSDRIAPGETQSFTLSVFCASYVGCDDGILDGWSQQGRDSASLAMLFAYGPNGDGAFGATNASIVPEPGTAALLAFGLAALARARSRRR